MAKEWREVRDAGRQLRAFDEERAASLRDRMRGEVRRHRLAEIRKARNMSQAAVADAVGVKQPRVSAIERGQLSRTELGTLQSYVEALGGRVRIIVEFGDESFPLV